MQNFNSKFKTDLIGRSYQFGLEIIAHVDAFPQKRSAWVIADQLIRAATSIGANLVEAKAASSRLEFKKFYEIALKSSNETKYWLMLARDAHVANSSRIGDLLQEVTELANMIAKSVMTLKHKS